MARVQVAPVAPQLLDLVFPRPLQTGHCAPLDSKRANPHVERADYESKRYDENLERMFAKTVRETCIDTTCR